jgi:uncharacterized protein
MDKATAVNIAHQFSDLIRTHIPVSKVVLFGSQVKGNSHADSDIDIAVLVNDLPADYLKTSAELFKMRKQINLLIEPILLSENNDRSGFIDEILRTGEIIYSATVHN